MRCRAFATLIFVFQCFTLRAQPQDETNKRPASEEQQVLEVNRVHQEALLRGDIAVLERIYAPDVVFIGGDGRKWNKAERLEELRSATRTVRSARDEQAPRVRVYGDTAILDFSGWAEGMRNGREFKSRSFLTRVYMKRNGNWQLVHQHNSFF